MKEKVGKEGEKKEEEQFATRWLFGFWPFELETNRSIKSSHG